MNQQPIPQPEELDNAFYIDPKIILQAKDNERIRLNNTKFVVDPLLKSVLKHVLEKSPSCYRITSDPFDKSKMITELWIPPNSLRTTAPLNVK